MDTFFQWAFIGIEAPDNIIGSFVFFLYIVLD